MSCRPPRQSSIRPGSQADRGVITYIDTRTGTPHCATCEGIVATQPGFSGELNALIGDLQFALDCVAIFGGIPIPVKQDLCRKMGAVSASLIANHIMHDILRIGGESEGD